MARYTLTLSPNYVKNWTISDAIREFLQNAIDQESQDEQNKKDIRITDNTLIIANATSILTKSSLLLGGGTKQEGDSNIGQFGEGYKVGLLVLLREGFKVEINNYSASEKWIPKIVKSRIYQSEVLAIDTKEYKFEGIQPNSLEIKISKDGFNFKEILSNIWLEFDYPLSQMEYIKTPTCDILLDETYKNKLYVKGLYIGELSGVHYGYNFQPNRIKIGRDRNLVNSWDIMWELARHTWNNIDFEDEKACNLLSNLIKKGASEVEYLEVQYLPEKFQKDLIEEYKDSYVISGESDKQAIKETYGDVDTVIVPSNLKNVIYKYQELDSGIKVKVKTGKDLLEEFISTHQGNLTEDMLDELEIILERI